MGLPILLPCSRLSGSLALHPIAVCISPCVAATNVAGVMEKNERQKTVWGEEGGEEQSSQKNLYKRKMNGVFKVTKPKLNRQIL